MPLLSKPAPCRGCALDERGEGFAPADGPSNSWLLLVGEALGKVEALTGRPFCLEENTRVLCADLVWRPIKDLRIGDALIACDEETPRRANGGVGKSRRLRIATVLRTITREAECFAVKTPDGTILATAEHRFLTAKNGGNRGGGRRWLRVEQLQGWGKTGKRGSRLVFLGKPWQQRRDWEAGWLAGFLDGEGHVGESRALGRTRRGYGKAGRIGFSQNAGPTADQAVALFQACGYTTRSKQEQRRNGVVCERHHLAQSTTGVLRFLGEIRPERLLSNYRHVLAHCPLPLTGITHPRVESRSSADVRRVVDITTTTGTFIAEGFIAHNCGDAGGMLHRLLNLLGWQREALRIHNVISCRPPNDWFDERAPWYYPAMNHCPYLATTLNDRPQVVVTMGGTALRKVMGFEHLKKIRVQDFHGAILRDPTDRFWVLPTYHPSFLQRGAHNLIGTVLWDLQRAVEARDHGKVADNASLVIDPPVEWFKAWVDTVIAARQHDPAAYPISSDVETPDKAGGKDEGEITAEDRSFQILRVNVACHTDEGITVPFVGPYIDELRRLHQSPGAIWEWNREYDFQRQVHAGLFTEADSPRVVDLMRLAHVLQSDLPRGLGFWAPFYSAFGPWKHLANLDPARYGAIDGLQNHRIGFGVISDLIQLGMYETAMRHSHRLFARVLRPAQLVGLKVDRQRLLIFKQDLADKARASLAAVQTCVPESLAPLTPKQGLTRPPLADVLHVKATAFTRKGKPRAGKPVPEIKQELYATARVIEKVVLKEVLACKTCGAVDVPRRHRCPDLPRAHDAADGANRAVGRVPQLVLEVASVHRWFWQEPFNPDSPPQILAYIKSRKHTPGKAKKTHKDSTDRETLIRLTKTGDPFYDHVLDYRAVNKVKSTYVEGTERRLDADDRLHPQPTDKPSMMRLSYVNPNITNVVADKGATQGGRGALAAGFRRCIVASPGCRLLECDFSAIEAKETGWWARDPKLIRLAALGIHSYLIAVHLKDAPDLSAPDEDIVKHLKAIKTKAGPLLYDQVKHTVYGVLYGQTPMGLHYTWPHLYPSLKVAEEQVQFMFAQLPSVQKFQHTVCDLASRQHYLGGPGVHPFGYKHWFWSIYTYRRLTATQYYRIVAKYQRANLEPPVTVINGQYFRIAHGPDANRAISYYPQSTAEGVLELALLRLLEDPDSPSYIGDAYFGRTPLRAPIHDSGLFDIPIRQWDHVVERVCLEMQRPVIEQPMPAEWGMGSHLTIGIAAKAGQDWEAMEEFEVPRATPSALDGEFGAPMEIEDVEDWSDLQRAV